MKSFTDRFWEKVVKGPAPSDCWIWTGAIADDGYGRFSLSAGGREIVYRPHRLSFALAHGLEIVPGEPLQELDQVMHECDVPICVHAVAGPGSHLVEGTHRLNMIDREQKGRTVNGTALRWRGLPRAEFARRSRALRDEVKNSGWSRPEHIAALAGGHDPDQPTLF